MTLCTRLYVAAQLDSSQKVSLCINEEKSIKIVQLNCTKVAQKLAFVQMEISLVKLQLQ